MKSIGIVYITQNRLYYVEKSLPQLLANTKLDFNLYVVDNGSTDGTLEFVSSIHDPRIKMLVRHRKNQKQTRPINWLWSVCTEDLVGKFDDDGLVPPGWLEDMSSVFDQRTELNLGAVAATNFHPDDVAKANYQKNIVKIGSREIVRQPHVTGACYIIRSEIVKKFGPLKETNGNNDWINFEWMLGKNGYVHGLAHPLVMVINMDDPRFGMRNPGDIRMRESDDAWLDKWPRKNVEMLSSDPGSRIGMRGRR